MKSKPKACCANCEWCDKNGYKCKRSGAFVEKWMFCTYYHGNGITPAQEIEQANKRIAELEAKLQEANELNDNAALNYADLKADLDVALEYMNKPITVNGVEIEREAVAEILADWNRKYATPLKSLSQFLKENKHLMGYLMKKANLSPFRDCVVGIETADGYLEETVGNLTDCIEASAPAAKPIVWYPWDGKGKPCVCFAPLGGYCLTIEEQDGEYYLYYHGTQLPPSPFSRHTPFKSVEAAKQVAQDWLNKLVAQCAVGGRTIPQFTENEIRLIRRFAKDYVGEFSQAYPMQPIVALAAKCNAMLEGATNEQ